MARTSSSGSGGRRHASSSHNVIGLGASAASGDGGGASSSADAEQPPALRVTAAKLSASEHDARIRRVVSAKQVLTFTAQCSLFTLSVNTDAGGKISLISGVLQQSVADVLGGGQALSLYGCVNDENGRQISVTASLLVTRLPSTEDVQFNGHISIGGGGESFALSATSDETSLIGPSGSIAFTVEEEIFFNAQDVEEEEENFQDSRETLDKDDWIDNCAERVAENLQSSGVDPSIIEEWRETAKSCHDNDMGEEIFLYRASDLLFTHCQAIALNILLSLVAMHPATYIVILWIRSSPPYVVAYFVSQVCASLYDFRIGIRLTPFLKWARLLIAYRMWRASGRDSLLLPIHVEGKGKLGWDTKSWSSYHQVLRLIKRISSQGQTPVLFMTCITRLCRNPLCFAEMIEEIRSSGGEVLTLRQWNTDFTRLPQIIFAWIKWMTVQAAVRAEGSTNANPLPQNRSDEITAIGRAGSELILKEGTDFNRFVIKATLDGATATKENSSLFDRVNAILSRDRMATLQGGVDSLEEIKREVDAVLRDLEGTRPRCKSDGSPSTIVQFTRTSPGSNAAVLQVTHEQFVAVHQCAINVHAAMEKV